MKRIRLIAVQALAIVCLVLCVATIAIESTSGLPALSHTRALFGRWDYAISDEYGLQFVLFHHARQHTVGPVIPMGVSPEWTAWITRYRPYARWHGRSFGFEVGPIIGTDITRHAIAGGTRLGLMAPYWAVQLLLVIPAVFVWTPRWCRRVNDPGAQPCSNCGYDRRATPQRCPECGNGVSVIVERTMPV